MYKNIYISREPPRHGQPPSKVSSSIVALCSKYSKKKIAYTSH